MVKALYSIRIRIIGIIAVTLPRFGFTSSDALVSPEVEPVGVYLQTFVMSLLSTILAWEGNRLLVVFRTRRQGLRQMSTKNFFTEVLLIIVLNTILYVLFLGVMILLEPEQQPPLVYLIFGLVDRWLYGLLIAGFYELMVFVYALRSAREEAEELKKLNVTIQLESLKNQVKPHFLFNSLNTLTGLVETNSDQAVRFIAELSNVYRYLLQSSEKELIALEEELKFSRAYFFLLQMRFGDAIQLVEDVDSNAKDCLLPPLTLQMLLENCIKHNQVSARKPLTMRIESKDGEWLVVSNNLQPKRSPLSTGVGLSNIAAKLRLLNQPPIEIEKTESDFIIKIPLFKPATV